jgi:hypothetical protein
LFGFVPKLVICVNVEAGMDVMPLEPPGLLVVEGAVDVVTVVEGAVGVVELGAGVVLAVPGRHWL